MSSKQKSSFSNSYAQAGVDINAGYKAVELMKEHIAKTKIDGVIGDIGGFGGLFAPDFKGIKKPIFVSGTDGVGTKLQIAMTMNKHNTVGIDCVAMCVNDIICCGARPLFFLDYIACGKNYPEKIASIVEGIAEGCVQAGCALIGGETAEHPGMMPDDQYDIAGFAVGVVDEDKILRPETQEEGDVLIGIRSLGVHSNGFSLIRKIFDVSEEGLNREYEELGGYTLGKFLLMPTMIYVKPILELLETVPVKAIAHITGGGIYENVARIVPDGLVAKIDWAELRKKPNYSNPLIFDLIAKTGKIDQQEMFNIFNMGIGMVVSVPPKYVTETLSVISSWDMSGYEIGHLVKSDPPVRIYF